MSWTAPRLRLLPLVLLLLVLAAPAGAVGPFSHFTFCQELWPSLAPRLAPDPAGQRRLWPVFLAGAIAHDAGYYPGADSGLAYAVHLLKPWRLTRAMLALAQTPRERAFAWGWLSHALLDLRAHRDLVNVFTQGPFSEHKLLHKQFEWGLDCWLLARPQGDWLWDAPLAWRPGLELWQRALAGVYGRQAPLTMLARAMDAHQREVRRLPYVFWFSGRLERPGRWAGNALGWLLGHTVRPAYVYWLRWSGGSLDVQAVLSARWPSPADTAGLKRVLRLSREDFDRVLAGGPWPRGILDADEHCADGHCPDTDKARRWLASLPLAP